MVRPVDPPGGKPMRRSAQESKFEAEIRAPAHPATRVKLGAKEYDEDLGDSLAVLRLKRAISKWVMPPPKGRLKPLARVLPDGDPRLVPTLNRPGREAFRAGLVKQLVAAAPKQLKPTAYVFAGPMGVGKTAIEARLFEQHVVSSEVVKADADALHALVPEERELEELGDARALSVVHEEASQIGKEAFAIALREKRDVFYNTMFTTPSSQARLQQAKNAGFRRVTLAVVSSLDVARARAGAGGLEVDQAVLAKSHRDFAAAFDELVKQSDELVLMLNDGARLTVIAQAKAGQLKVKDPLRWAQFQAMKDPGAQ